MQIITILTDCQSVGATLHSYEKQTRCIQIGSAESKVDRDTGRVEGCVEQFGSNATLLALPDWDTELWDLIQTLTST